MADTIITQFPSVQVGLVTEDSDVYAETVINRIPEDGEIEVPLYFSPVETHLASNIRFQIFDPGSNLPDASNYRVSVNDVTVFEAGGETGGWLVYVEPLSPDEPAVLVFAMVPPQPFQSSEVVTVTVTSIFGDPIASWSFTMQDLTRPALENAGARDVRTVLARFDEPMDFGEVDGNATALNPENYVLSRVSTFAVLLQPVAAERIDNTTVALTFSAPLTFGAAYTLTVSNARDVRGNVVDEPPNNSITFTGFNPDTPEGRRFQLWDFIPEQNKREDKSTRDLFRFISVLQEVTNVLLYEIDRFADLIDPDLAPERFVDAMLADLGNPFPTSELSLADRRRLLAVLVSIYQQKGTTPGVVDAVRFLLGLEVEIHPVPWDGWLLGVGELGETTVLGPETQYQLYSFAVHAAVPLTAVQYKRVDELVDFMKPPHTHHRIIDGTSTVGPEIDHVALGYSLLGENFILH